MNHVSKRLVMMLMLITLTVGLIGCSSKNKSKIKNPSKVTTSATFPKTITDSYGNEVELKEEPKRIISVAPNITEMIYALGAEDKLVARTDYCDYPSEVTKLESIGSILTPDMEKIVSLEPDVVITSTHFSEENAKKLNDLGIPVIELYEEKDVTGVYDMLTILGDVVSKQDKAASLASDMKTRFDKVISKVDKLDKPTVYYVVSYGEYGDYTAGGDTFVGNLLTMAGAENVATDVSGWEYSFEKLVEADPEIIIVRNGEKDAFMQTDGYKDLTAVKEGHVYEIDNNLLDRQGYRNAEGVEELAKIIHPEAFK